MDEKGLGYEIYDGTGTKAITVTIRVEEINWNTKKTLIKTPYPGDPTTETGTDVDFYYIDLKNVEEAVRIRGVLDDSVEVASTATSGGNSTLTDSIKSWTNDQYINYYVKLHKSNGTTETKKITDNTDTVLTITGTWTSNPVNEDSYEIIYPAWMKFWQLRAMVTTGLRLDSFVIGDISDSGLDFDGSHTGGDSWDPSGATLEDVTMTLGPDDTGQINAPLSDVSRMTISCTLIIGDDIQNVT